MPLVDVPLYVEAQAVGVAWEFKARCYVEDPAGSMNWRRGTFGEVEVIFDLLGEWYQFTQELERKNCDANGDVIFAGQHPGGGYAMTAKHNISGEVQKVRIDCYEDGTYTTTIEIQ